ncbi:hypothetical protein [Aureimonas sp. AU40]|uniref:hypothetical protein n=1 Tax=Aureimonas sp. AU40 TaxID=1637747 RepID=UPI000783E3F6|nr:hypothetical protein [Aureimonas sp. AU40]
MTRRTLLLPLMAGLSLWAAVSPSSANWSAPGVGGVSALAPAASHEPDERPELLAQGGCSSAAAQAAAQTGGQVLSVQISEQGGRTVCVVTVLVPARDGSRPRRQTITIPQ